MDTKPLERFATAARRSLIAQVTAQLDRVLRSEGALRATHASAIDRLKIEIARHSRAGVIERVAYTWFNRFCALRMLDANNLQTPLVVSPAAGESQPQILQQALQGFIDPALPVDRTQVLNLLMGRTASANPQQDAYALLLVAACNRHHATMPFLFQEIDDYTELLIPADLLSPNSILAELRRAFKDEVCKDVEVIGWLYQFYISEKKDEVNVKVKKGGRIEPEELPTMTSLYTPDWIVRYLVENSLGRLWLLNRPHSTLGAQMEYYIPPDPAQPATDFLKVSSPEELTLCDPACGSGHMLTYAFDLLYAIYREEGYSASDIPRLILQKNLYGVEIDPRSRALAAFALTLKACQRDPRFLERNVTPHITLLESVDIAEREIAESPLIRAMRGETGAVKLFDALIPDLFQWDKASIVGSLLRPQLTPVQIARVRQRTAGSGETIAEKMRQVLDQAEPLARKYDVVVTNPPYIGPGWNEEAKEFANSEYARAKSDYFAMFVERNMDLATPGGQLGLMTPFVWMFISSYEGLRKYLIDEKTITSLVQLEYGGFEWAVVPLCAFTAENAHHPEMKGGYIRLSDFKGADNQGPKTLEAVANPNCGWFYRAAAADFKKIPGSPIAYWVSEILRQAFSRYEPLENYASPKIGMRTGDNDRFMRRWYESEWASFRHPSSSSSDRSFSWYPYMKGGAFRKWYGNQDFVVFWENDGYEIKKTTLENYPQLSWDNLGWKISNEQYYLQEGITWTDISSSSFGVRYMPEGFIFDASGPCLFSGSPYAHLAFLSTKLTFEFLTLLNPTFHFKNYNIAALPYAADALEQFNVSSLAKSAVMLAKSDWDAYETSWDFTTLPLLDPAHRGSRLENTYNNLRRHWQQQSDEMQRLEEENNRIFIDAYGLQDELTPDVPRHEITLTCNPAYRYGAGKSEEEYATLQRADTMREFISYAVGCCFGRYSVDKPGLVLANQGETLQDYLRIVATDAPTHRRADAPFTPDADNVLPILDGDWFPDDIVARIKEFLRLTFGDAHFVENLAFLEASLGKDLRAYMVRDFYNDHVRRYQKRPIYWLFSSEGGAFNALIYMHRYRSDTASVVLNTYLRPFHAKVEGQRKLQETVANDASLPQAQRTRAQREVDRLRRVLVELETYERDVLYPLATERIEIDLDDGVKVNYAKFGKALRAIPGVSK